MQGGSLSDWLFSLSVPATAVGTILVMLTGAGIGRLVRRAQMRKAQREEKESEPSVAQEGYLLAGALGLLGLLLAFSFGMVLNRYEARRELVTTEANAIGTAYLRSQLLDEPYRTRLSKLLIAYTENRINLASSGGTDSPYVATNDHMLTEIWATVKASRESALAHGLTTALLMTFNEVIDLDTERKVAWELRVPVEVIFLLLAYLAVTAAVVGHQVDGPRGRRAAFLLFGMVGLSVAVITDLNRPMTGHSRESQKAMLMLLASLKAQPPQVFDQVDSSSSVAGRQQ